MKKIYNTPRIRVADLGLDDSMCTFLVSSIPFDPTPATPKDIGVDDLEDYEGQGDGLSRNGNGTIWDNEW